MSDVALLYQDGQLLNSRLLDYRIPTMADLPAALRSILVENANGPGPHGSKSIGESGLRPPSPTIAPVIGVRLTALQLPPDAPGRVCAARGIPYLPVRQRPDELSISCPPLPEGEGQNRHT